MNRIYLTPQEVADAFNVSIKTLSNHRSLGTGLPFVKFEGIIRYPKDKVEAYIKSKIIGGQNHG
tara:strand:+ start:300 stop:491 length:192 start_codon:yes stop_codon:yes gene_type:complete